MCVCVCVGGGECMVHACMSVGKGKICAGLCSENMKGDQKLSANKSRCAPRLQFTGGGKWGSVPRRMRSWQEGANTSPK